MSEGLNKRAVPGTLDDRVQSQSPSESSNPDPPHWSNPKQTTHRARRGDRELPGRRRLVFCTCGTCEDRRIECNGPDRGNECREVSDSRHGTVCRSIGVAANPCPCSSRFRLLPCFRTPPLGLMTVRRFKDIVHKTHTGAAVNPGTAWTSPVIVPHFPMQLASGKRNNKPAHFRFRPAWLFQQLVTKRSKLGLHRRFFCGQKPCRLFLKPLAASVLFFETNEQQQPKQKDQEGWTKSAQSVLDLRRDSKET